ncbi:MAG TPA: transcriptional repressor [Nitrospirales bacterium]|nr:transcriptional repressor [Nitrospirales bacterium]
MEISFNDIKQKFQGCGLKTTPQRTAIYDALFRSTTHPTAEELFAEVAPQFPMMSLNTVYYTLGALRTCGLIHEVNIGHIRARFDANLSPHHHLICLGCQSIVDVIDPRLNRLTSPAGIPKDFEITSYQVAFRGLCGSCRRRTGRSINHSSPGLHPTTVKGGLHGKSS